LACSSPSRGGAGNHVDSQLVGWTGVTLENLDYLTCDPGVQRILLPQRVDSRHHLQWTGIGDEVQDDALKPLGDDLVGQGANILRERQERIAGRENGLSGQHRLGVLQACLTAISRGVVTVDRFVWFDTS
jgi:hypothetical protein